MLLGLLTAKGFSFFMESSGHIDEGGDYHLFLPCSLELLVFNIRANLSGSPISKAAKKASNNIAHHMRTCKRYIMRSSRNHSTSNV